jgi:hypothetical protein
MHLIKASMDGQLPFIPTSLPHLYEQASSLAAKISKDQTRNQFDILDKSLITADADREALALQELQLGRLILPLNCRGLRIEST